MKQMDKQTEKIFELFTRNHKLKFSDIERELDIRSNHLNYYLRKLQDENLIEKKEENYILTQEAEKLIPFLKHLQGKEQGPLSIITAAILNKNKILLLKRDKRPYKNYWGLIGGKQKLEESIKETAIRESKEETGLDCKYEKLCSILHERVQSNNETKHAFNIFFCKLTTNKQEIIRCEEGELNWFDLDNLPKNIIPSDKYMIENLLDNKLSFKEVLIKDTDGKLNSMKIK